MRIGIDFDNTLVDYDALFHRVALERALVPADAPASKLGVRDHLRQTGREADWTELQGYVYGARMGEAPAYPGAIEFLAWASGAGIGLAIVSHRTLRPFHGPPYDLHEAARVWVRRFLTSGPRALVDDFDVHFELSLKEKLARIAALDLDCFIDDLPEVLLAEEFPARTARLLFDPEGRQGRDGRTLAFRSWEQLRRHIEDRWTRRD